MEDWDTAEYAFQAQNEWILPKTLKILYKLIAALGIS